MLKALQVSFFFRLFMNFPVVKSLAMPRVELFFRTTDDLTDRLEFLKHHDVTSVNLVNKHSSDSLLDWVADVEDTGMHCCVHYSLKFQKISRGKTEQHFEKFKNFLEKVPSRTEVLIVSGSIKNSSWNTVVALQKLQEEGVDRKVAVAYNPFFENEEDALEERRRLQQKVDTGRVSKIYLQFGTDLSKAKRSLKELNKLGLPIGASIFLPTKQLIAQQKFRPWKGVFLSDWFLKGHESARDVVVELLRLYHSFNVEILVEAPGVRKTTDMDLVNSLLNEAQRAGKNTEQSTSTPTEALSTINSAMSTQRNKRLKRSGESSATTASTGANTEASPAIVLFGSHDVRLHDNEALELASKSHSHILFVFLWESPATWGAVGAVQVVLKDALQNLADDLQMHDLHLVCRNTYDSVQELVSLVKECGAKGVYFNREMTPCGRVRESLVSKALTDLHVSVVACQSSLLYDVEKLELGPGFHGGHWGTLMPFLKGCQKQFGKPQQAESSTASFARLEAIKPPKSIPSGVPVNDLKLAVMPPCTKWDVPIRERFPMTSESAKERLDKFFSKGLPRYESERSRADKDVATSQLSVHLRIGTISPYELYWRTESSALGWDQKKTFYRRLFWRDLAYYQLFCFPEMPETSIRLHYEKTNWVHGENEQLRLQAWKKGRTGYPIVDAAMRELYETGWMTQSVRMVVASFLTEYLRINWTHGARWFHDTLVDADCAINSMMWQNAGRSGTDQWNFVLSPENASQDPTGEYTRKWVPELRKLPTRYLHKPWQAPEQELRVAKVVLGGNYPCRVVSDLKAERAKSVENVLSMRRESQEMNDDKGYDLICLPNKTQMQTVVFTRKEYRIDREGKVMKQNSAPKRRRNVAAKSKKATNAAKSPSRL